MVVLTIIMSFKVKRILVDGRIVVKVLSWDTYSKMGLKKHTLFKVSSLYSLANHPVEVRGLITLLVTLGDDEHTTMKYVQFYVVDYPMAYNAIFKRPIIRMKKMVVAIFFMKFKFSIETGVGFLQSDQQIVRQCHIHYMKIGL
ncbi:hypothetical protein PVK06_039658 [Gossypium arboreum]|uniref:Uncharacterized protein n=1 Tax=Gossypium arboreum TaxID=29729 RepID=A0ABR0N3G5_GOSAR|nr:hypothetical protein PVK06_039658 [Gossypium arboreum]